MNKLSGLEILNAVLQEDYDSVKSVYTKEEFDDFVDILNDVYFDYGDQFYDFEFIDQYETIHGESRFTEYFVLEYKDGTYYQLSRNGDSWGNGTYDLEVKQVNKVTKTIEVWE